jgi:hypothetical protein
LLTSNVEERAQAHGEQVRQEPELDPVQVMPASVQGFDRARNGGVEAHLLERDRGEVDEENGKEKRFQEGIEALFDEVEKRDGCVEEISREEEEQRHVERVDQALDEQGDDFKIIVPQNDEQDSDAFCDVKIFNSFDMKRFQPRFYRTPPCPPQIRQRNFVYMTFHHIWGGQGGA